MGDPKSHKLIAGNVCLDFVNTINGHGSDNPNEYLSKYNNFVVRAHRLNLF
jgi:hypothetical protein